MNFERLRQLLLEKAIRGKLVPQLESEPEVRQIGEAPKSVPFKIPKKWKWTTIGESLLYGGTEQTMGQHIPKDAWVLDLEDIEKDSGKLLIKKRGLPGKSNKAKFKKGDVLYGKLRPYLNKCIIADEDGFSTTEIVAIRQKEGSFKFDSGYLKIFLMSPFFVDYANHVSYGVKMPRLGTKDAKAALIPVPPLREQCRIAKRWENLLAVVEKGEVAHAELLTMRKVLRNQILLLAIQGKLVPQLESEPGVEQVGDEPDDAPFKIPKKWKWTTIGESLLYGSTEQIKGQHIPKDAWVLDLEDIEKNSGKLLIKKRGLPWKSNKAKFKKGDVLYGKLRPYLNKCIIADEDGFSTTEIVAVRPKEGSFKFDSGYLKIFLMSPFFVDYANRISYGVKMPRLGTKDAKVALIPVPPLREQQRIVAKLNKLLPFIDQMET